MLNDHRRIRLSLLVVLFAVLLTAAVAGPLAAQATFARAGDLTVGRNWPTATLLKDGRVLVTGGTHTENSGSVFNKSADLFDPSTGAFTATGAMNSARIFHSAALLNDGRVLVIGGEDPSANPTDTADLFDPAAGTFKPTGSLVHPRYFNSATTLKDGRVLVAGGFSLNANGTGLVVGTAELYDPAAGTFAATGSLSARREEQTAVALADGRALIFGGLSTSGGTAFPTDVEAFDPASGSFTTIGQLSQGRQNLTATLLTDGRVLIAGGFTLSSDGSATIASNTVEIFDPATGSSKNAGTMTEGRASHVAVALADGRVLLAGGRATLDGNTTNSADLYDPKTGKITPAASLMDARAQAAAVRLLDGRVLIVGGAQFTNGNVSARLQTAELYTP